MMCSTIAQAGLLDESAAPGSQLQHYPLQHSANLYDASYSQPWKTQRMNLTGWGSQFLTPQTPVPHCPAPGFCGPQHPSAHCSMKPVYETETTTCYRTEWETEYREQEVTIQRPVYETHYREQNYQVSRPVWETVEQEIQKQVCKPIVETVEQCYEKVVYKQVTETIEQERCYTEMVPVTTYNTVQKDMGCWVNQPYQTPGRCVTRRICDPCGRVRFCTVRIPGKTCYRRVWQPKIVNCQIPCTTYQQRVVRKTCPVQVCRVVPETITCKVPVQVTRYVHETVCEKVPVKVCRWETETKTRKIPYQVCRMETEVVMRKVPHRVAKQVPYEVTRQVCRWIACETPVTTACSGSCDPCGSHIGTCCSCHSGACETQGCPLPATPQQPALEQPEPAVPDSTPMPETEAEAFVPNVWNAPQSLVAERL